MRKSFQFLAVAHGLSCIITKLRRLRHNKKSQLSSNYIWSKLTEINLIWVADLYGTYLCVFCFTLLQKDKGTSQIGRNIIIKSSHFLQKLP